MFSVHYVITGVDSDFLQKGGGGGGGGKHCQVSHLDNSSFFNLSNFVLSWVNQYWIMERQYNKFN